MRDDVARRPTKLPTICSHCRCDCRKVVPLSVRIVGLENCRSGCRCVIVGKSCRNSKTVGCAVVCEVVDSAIVGGVIVGITCWCRLSVSFIGPILMHLYILSLNYANNCLVTLAE